MMKTTGSWWTAGQVHRLMRVAPLHRAVARPSQRHPRLLADLERQRGPDRHRHHRRQVADHGDQAEPDVRHVDVAVAPAGQAVGAAHVLGEDPPRLGAAGDVDAHVALDRRADVVRPHRRRDAHRGTFVAAPGVEGAGDLALPVEDVAPLLDPAGDQHVPVDLEQILPVKIGLSDVLRGLDRYGFSGDCHPCIKSSATCGRVERRRPCGRIEQWHRDATARSWVTAAGFACAAAGAGGSCSPTPGPCPTPARAAAAS